MTAALEHLDVSVVTSGHDVADARLHRLVAALQRQGSSVEVLGLGDPVGAPYGVPVRTWARPGMLGRAWLAARLGWLARGRVVLVLDPDALVLAAVATAARRRRLVADVHEDYGRLLHDRGWATGLTATVAQVLVRLAERVAARAALTLVADEHVPPARARHRLVVRNEPDPSLLPPVTEPAAEPRAVYVGDVRASRGLVAMLDAIAAAPHWRLDVVGPVAAGDQTALDARLAADPDLSSRVVWHGRLQPCTAWEVARGAWAGLCLLEDTPAFRDAVPSKLYEYLAAGLVPIATDLPRQRELLEEAGAGLVVADAAGAAEALRLLEADPALHSTLREKGLAWSRARSAGPTAYDVAAARIKELARAC